MQTQKHSKAKTARLDSLVGKRHDIAAQIDTLQRERSQVEYETVAELMELGMSECFTVNWRAVARMLRR